MIVVVLMNEPRRNPTPTCKQVPLLSNLALGDRSGLERNARQDAVRPCISDTSAKEEREKRCVCVCVCVFVRERESV